MTVDLKAEKKFQMEAQASGLEADYVCVLDEKIRGRPPTCQEKPEASSQEKKTNGMTDSR